MNIEKPVLNGKTVEENIHKLETWAAKTAEELNYELTHLGKKNFIEKEIPMIKDELDDAMTEQYGSEMDVLRGFNKKVNHQYIHLERATNILVDGNVSIPFDRIDNFSKCFTPYDTKDGVLVGKGVNRVRVSFICGGSYGTTGAAERIWAHINQERHGINIASADAIAYGGFCSPYVEMIANVKEGDVFTFYTTEKASLRNGGVKCYVNIEKIE